MRRLRARWPQVSNPADERLDCWAVIVRGGWAVIVRDGWAVIVRDGWAVIVRDGCAVIVGHASRRIHR
jgi:hypothetical protein